MVMDGKLKLIATASLILLIGLGSALACETRFYRIPTLDVWVRPHLVTRVEARERDLHKEGTQIGVEIVAGVHYWIRAKDMLEARKLALRIIRELAKDEEGI